MKLLGLKILSALVAITVTLLSQCLNSADIDIFRNNSVNIQAPNVLFVVDNSANWNSHSSGVSKQQIIHEALFKFLDGIKRRFEENPDFVGINIGILVYASGNSPRGAKAIQGFLKIESASSSSIDTIKSRLYCNKDAFKGKQGKARENDCLAQLTTEWGSSGFDRELFYGSEKLPKADNAPMALALNEAYLWFAGKPYQAGKQDGSQKSTVDGYDPAAFNGDNYISPISESACAHNSIVFVSNGGPDSGENNLAESKLNALGGVFAGDPLSTGMHSGEQASWLDEYARYLNSSDINDLQQGMQNISVYAIDVFTALNPSGEQYNPLTDAKDYKKEFGLTKSQASSHALLYNASAGVGGGDYLQAADADALAEALSDVTDTILEKNSVFAAVSLPVSVNIKGTSENQIYMGVFRPSQKPRWAGNLKLYQIALDTITGKPILVDGDGNPAEDTNSGFLESNARSFWTATSNYWQNIPALSVPRGSVTASASDNPDGKEVERGGVAQGLREYIGRGRIVYTCSGFCNSLENFTASNPNLKASAFNAADRAEMDKIINWSKGIDTQDADNDKPTDTSDIRPNVHGDVIHSQPVIINYGGNTGSYVFYGSNDGMFHAVKGGVIEKAESSGSKDGEEAWAFTAPEQFKKLKVLYENRTYSGSFGNKPYFFDGAVGSYIVYNGNAEVSKAIIYLTARRGGDLIYALDVTNPQTPVIKWRKSSADNGFSEMGQTWSKPTISKIKVGSSDRIVLIMGLGYDQAVDDGISTTRTQGRGVIVIDAESGTDIWQVTSGTVSNPAGTVLTEAAMSYSVPADLAVVDRDGNGYSDRVYFGDTGGQLWRLDIGSATLSEWRASRLFKFSATATQRFLNAPDVVASPDGKYDMLIIGSGNREQPVDTSVQNYMLFYRDYDQAGVSTVKATLQLSDLAKADTLGGSALSESTLEFDPDQNIALDSKFLNGWYLPLQRGEKVVTSALTANKTTLFATNMPGINRACSDLGEARIYKIDPFVVAGAADGDKNYSEIEGGGVLPSPEGFTVMIEVESCDSDGKCNTKNKPISGILFGFHAEDTQSDPLGVRRKVWWYNQRD